MADSRSPTQPAGRFSLNGPNADGCPNAQRILSFSSFFLLLEERQNSVPSFIRHFMSFDISCKCDYDTNPVASGSGSSHLGTKNA
jgi:hypothetical protein